MVRWSRGTSGGCYCPETLSLINSSIYISFYLLCRVLTLWFDYGHWPEVNEALVEGIKTIQIDTWLQVKCAA